MTASARAVVRFAVVCLYALGLAACERRVDHEAVPDLALIPWPRHIRTLADSFVVSPATPIQIVGADSGVINIAHDLAVLLGSTGPIEPVGRRQPLYRAVRLEIQRTKPGAEGYKLTISADGVLITASACAGLFYGVQTLRQLLPPAAPGGAALSGAFTLPALAIEDEPRFAWRGLELDVARHLFSLAYLERFIDRMAAYKLNVFHLHLTDDQAWRIAMEHYPELTTRGAWREPDDRDWECLRRAHGDSTYRLPEVFLRERNGKIEYGGYYTKADMAHLVAYAALRHVTIVPEIDMPGHMRAAAEVYGLSTRADPDGHRRSSVTLAVEDSANIRFCETVLGEIAELFPGTYAHVGFDETQSMMDERIAQASGAVQPGAAMDFHAAERRFLARMQQFLRGKGKRLVGWDEVVDIGTDSSAVVMAWRGALPEVAARAARQGNPVVLCPNTHLYFDYEQDETSLRRVYDFRPELPGQSPEAQKRILGVQGNVWSDYIPTGAKVDYMTFPRAIALSEVAWSARSDWAGFERRMEQHYPRLDAMNVNYRAPDIPELCDRTVFLDSAVVRLDAPRPLRAAHYTLDGTKPGERSARYTAPLVIRKDTELRVVTYRPDGRRATDYTLQFDRQAALPAVAADRLQSGVRCYYLDSSAASVSELRLEKAHGSGLMPMIDLPAFVREDEFALIFRGYLRVPQTGIYTFALTSDDGSSLRIGERPVIDNDGVHAAKKQTGQIALEAGAHPFELRYFENKGEQMLRLEAEGPGLPLQVVGLPLLLHGR